MDSPKTMVEFMERFQTEDDCRKALSQHKWPEGFLCPRCRGRRAYSIQSRLLKECCSCGYQSSVTAGTIFHKTRVPLRKWFLAIYLMASTKKTLSAAELSRQLGVTLKTAWTMRRKIAHALAKREGELMLSGLVEMDESFLGGKSEGKRGRGASGKTLVAVMAERTESGGLALAHMRVIPTADGTSLSTAAQEVVTTGSTIKTDGLSSYRGLGALPYWHEPEVQGGPKNASKLLPWVHVVISNFKRWVLDIFHGVSSKHLQSYLDEFCYRLNRRYQRTDLFRRLLNRCCRFTEPVTYRQLVAS